MKLSQIPTLNINDKDYNILGLGSIMYIEDEESAQPILLQSAAIHDIRNDFKFNAFIVVPHIEKCNIPIFKVKC